MTFTKLVSSVLILHVVLSVLLLLVAGLSSSTEALTGAAILAAIIGFPVSVVVFNVVSTNLLGLLCILGSGCLQWGGFAVLCSLIKKNSK